MHPLAPILCATVPAAVCGLAHYLPWRHWFRRGRLPRLLAYSVGLLSILLPATVAAMLAAATVDQAMGLLWLAAGSAAAGTLIPWWLDWQRRAEYAAQDATDRTWANYGE